jgi:hypothetical protein
MLTICAPDNPCGEGSSSMTILLKLHPSTQLVERAMGSTRTFCDGSLGPAREGSFHFVTRPLRWKRDRSLASTPGSRN